VIASDGRECFAHEQPDHLSQSMNEIPSEDQLALILKVAVFISVCAVGAELLAIAIPWVLHAAGY